MTVFTVKPINQKAYPIPLFLGAQFVHLNEAQDNSAKTTNEWLASTFPAKKLKRIANRVKCNTLKQIGLKAQIEVFEKQIASIQKELDRLNLEDKKLQRGFMNEQMRHGDLEKISAYKIVQILD